MNALQVVLEPVGNFLHHFHNHGPVSVGEGVHDF